MLFNSYSFIFGFLPVAVLGFFLLGSRDRRMALGWIVLASLFFYAWWRPVNVLIIVPSMLVNYAVARQLARLAQQRERAAAARWLLIAGIAFNLCFLGYFKYINFFADVVNDLTHADIVLERVILPLGISFITFQKIAFLVDVHARRIGAFSFSEYCVFVLFFPQLVAGPIVHYREMMPQFQAVSARVSGADLAVGLTLFIIGLFKKVVLADGIAQYVSPVYAAAADGQAISLLPAWVAAVGFTLQLYFDFSGYSDMALGLARLFGVKLPANFDSPLKSRSIAEFWSRWHMTLTRFLTAYVYNPLVMRATRSRLAKRLPVQVGPGTRPGAFVQMLAVPTLVTMLLSGLWHGAGYLFLIWGLMHGTYLVLNHAWRIYGAPRMPGFAASRAWRGGAFLLTFVAVATAHVVFRATSVDAASSILAGMLGRHGISLPAQLADTLAPLRGALPWISVSAGELERTLVWASAWTAVLLLAALTLPSALQITAAFEPAVGYKARPYTLPLPRAFTAWRPALGWAAAAGALAIAAVLRLGAKSEFLYWQF